MGGGKGQSRQSLPKWAQNVGGALFGNAGDLAQGGGLFSSQSPYGGPFGDIVGGFNAASPQQLYGGLGPGPGLAAQIGQGFGQAGPYFGGQAAGLNQMLGQLGMGQAGSSNALSGMAPGFLGASAPFVSQLQDLVGKGGLADTLLRQGAGPFSGQAEGQALGLMKSMDPNGDLYKRAMALALPQVRSGYAARGMAGSGSAIQGESDAASQLADQLVQQSAQNKIGLLGQAVGGEQANAAMTGALSSLLGQRFSGLNAAVQGALGGAQLPGQLFGQFQGGLGQGLQNLTAASALNQSPLASLLQGQNLSMQGLQMAPAIANQTYAATRAPFLGLLQAFSGASGLSHPAGKVK